MSSDKDTCVAFLVNINKPKWITSKVFSKVVCRKAYLCESSKCRLSAVFSSSLVNTPLFASSQLFDKLAGGSTTGGLLESIDLNLWLLMGFQQASLL
ncbi:hypothetical protein Gasu2_17830 [Galdieria sulphuraria]|nr:hypothetical protein Gasu2_17830 [Galdieria sulphuraria]